MCLCSVPTLPNEGAQFSEPQLMGDNVVSIHVGSSCPLLPMDILVCDADSGDAACVEWEGDEANISALLLWTKTCSPLRPPPVIANNTHLNIKTKENKPQF